MYYFSKIWGGIACMLMMGSFASAQVLSNEEVFHIKDYSVQEYGYPLMVAPAGTDDFLYIEYWPENIAGRKESNYYLQKYKINDYGEVWFKPLTNIGYDQIPEVLDLMKFDKKYVVLGHMYSNKEKRTITVARFFEMDGKCADLEPVVISKYSRDAPKKDLNETFYVSPNEKCMMWFASNGAKHYATAWSSTGENMWGKEIEFPISDKYTIKDAAIDDKGNATFLLLNSKPTYTLKDTANKPMLMRINNISGQIAYEKIVLDSAYMILGHIKLINNDMVAVAGVASNFDPKSNQKPGILNGVKAGINNQRWTHFYYGQYKLADSLSIVSDSLSEIPERWKNFYQEGATFTASKLVLDGGATTKNILPSATLIFEEKYRSSDKIFFGDIATIGFQQGKGNVIFSERIAKKQIDNGSGAYFSYSLGRTKGKLYFVYLTEKGAAGKLMCKTLDLKSGVITEKILALNGESMYFFFPDRSRMVSANQMILIGVGNPSQNNYKLMTITF